ncbi:MAG: hypothetical protein GXP54_09320 [Deltaproteobacteria bacterium]|nr:hypothetical protein [Deltaproteobacteria bacterium]
MAPELEEGDEVLIRSVRPGDLAPGDVVAYTRGGRIISHVLLFSLGMGKNRRLFCKGTANRRGDPPVRWEDVVGRVTAVRKGGAMRAINRGHMEASGIFAGLTSCLTLLIGNLKAGLHLKGVAKWT